MSEETSNPTTSGSSAVSARGGFGRASRSLLRQPRFLVAAGLLLICAVGFNSLVTAMQLHFRKLPLKMQVKALDDKETGIATALPAERTSKPDLAPEISGHWVQVGQDRPLSADIEKDLGTKQYLNRDYVDRRLVPNKSFEDLRKLDGVEATTLLRSVQVVHPEGVIHLHMTYYTGLADTVAHIPDRCYVASGYEPTSYDVVKGPTEYYDGKAREVEFQVLRFDRSLDHTAQYVGYMFHCNGSYAKDPLEVRRRLQNLFETYGYYAKIELSISDIGGKDADDKMSEKSAKAMKEFLQGLLPEAERCLPDWERVKARDPVAIAP